LPTTVEIRVTAFPCTFALRSLPTMGTRPSLPGPRKVERQGWLRGRLASLPTQRKYT
jgi:hypothetical protein